MIANGTRLGPYEITAQLGAGGMGEVYRARDSRLDRTVAVKILAAHLTADPGLRERFEREAKAISALSHPHIRALFDIGSHDGIDYLVMEYLDGESLADRLARGPLPIEQVLRYGVEIAEALEKAHRAGIVHRDLKPGNIFLTKSGAKLLDFGLAKLGASGAMKTSDPNAATAAMSRQKPLTEEGTILGTFQYMAPEQIEGREADARTDIFAFGAVLYEMATGRRAFEAKTKASLIASILDRDPAPMSTLQPVTPLALERVVKLCLAKDPDERWQSAHDVAAELKWIRDASSETIGPAARKRRHGALLRTAAIILGGVAIGAATTWLLVQRAPHPQQVARFTVQTPAPAPLLFEFAPLAISPDGTRIVYRGWTGQTSKLFLRAIDDQRIVPVAGTDGGHSPVFSPDGRWIAFIDSDAIYKVPREGGARVKITDMPGGSLGLEWDGETIYGSVAFAGGMWVAPGGGGKPRRFVNTNASAAERAIVWPSAIPGTDFVLATVWNAGSWDTARIIAYSTKDATKKVVLENAYFARYSPTGHLLFMRGGNLLALPFDGKTLRVHGHAVVVVSGVAYGTADGEAAFGFSRSGHLVYANGGDIEPSHALVWLDASGTRTPIVPTRRRYGSVHLAPDERSAAITLEGSTYDVWQLDFERDSVTRISHGGDDSDAVITPDGSRVIWVSSRAGRYDLYWRPLDNSNGEEAVAPSAFYRFVPNVAPDGRSLVFTQYGQRQDIWLMSLSTRKAQPLVASSFNDDTPSISPDGRWLAYTSDESGQNQIYVTTFPRPSGKWQVSTDGGSAPRWTPDGRGIVYIKPGALLRVPFESSPRPRAGKPAVIATGRFDDDFDIAQDGRIAIVENEKQPTTREFHVVLNFAQELKRRAPTP